jgi:hypothetical protein
MRSCNENSTLGEKKRKEKKRKREPKLSPRLLLRGVSPPVLDLPYLLRLELLSQAVTEKDTVNLLN